VAGPARRATHIPRGAADTRPIWIRLGVLALIFVALYAAMGIGGHSSPKLGLDLQGGTSVTLKPRVLTGNAKVSSSQLDQAVNIIRQRVDGLGVAEADVVRAGNQIEISVPGKGRDQVVKLVGQTAQLAFRIPAAESNAPATAPKATPTPTPTPSGSPSASPSPTTTPTISPTASAGTPTPSSSALTGQAAVPAVPVAATSAPATPTPSSSLVPIPSSQATATLPASPSASGSTTHCVTSPGKAGTTPPPCITAQLSYPCPKPGTTEGEQVAAAPSTDWIVACDTTGTIEYALQPASLKGTAVSGADATLQQGVNGTATNNWIVNVNFTSKGQGAWANLTDTISKSAGCPKSTTPAATNQNPVTCQLAVVLDGVVQSAPVIQERIPGSAEIQGSFTEKSASDLANVLKYGALPLTFTESQVTNISATLGKASLNAGLLAGAIGLGLVVIYSFIYYRALGIVTIASLVISAGLVYACIVELGVIINFTLTLAGIAGFIVAVGITADSFVVFYERLKDEVHEGRTVRTSVERAWVRARRTILSADTVSFLAAATLYYLSIGSVRGFAFTLGLSTILDLVVVFLFTKPVVTLLVRRPLFSTSRMSGLTAKALGTTTEAAAAGPVARPRLAKRTAPEKDADVTSDPGGSSVSSDREGS
jgi:preprotein translocase subunit SecD